MHKPGWPDICTNQSSFSILILSQSIYFAVFGILLQFIQLSWSSGLRQCKAAQSSSNDVRIVKLCFPNLHWIHVKALGVEDWGRGLLTITITITITICHFVGQSFPLDQNPIIRYRNLKKSLCFVQMWREVAVAASSWKTLLSGCELTMWAHFVELWTEFRFSSTQHSCVSLQNFQLSRFSLQNFQPSCFLLQNFKLSCFSVENF